MKKRVDQLVVDLGLAESRERAQRLIRAGLIFSGTQRLDKPGARVDAEQPLEIKGDACPYVSRGGLKLAGALIRFGQLDLAGLRALDIGASTGGFTDCLLQHGASEVWAVDTGRGQMHEKLRRDPRIRLREQANARYLQPEWLEGTAMDLIVIDVAFISLRLVLPPLPAVLVAGGWVLALVKPQFEAGPEHVGRGGVVRERAVHRRVLSELVGWLRDNHWRLLGLTVSPLMGPAGNIEFFVWLDRGSQRPELPPERDQLTIEQVLDEAYNQGRRSVIDCGGAV